MGKLGLAAVAMIVSAAMTGCGERSGPPAGTDWSPRAEQVDGLTVLAESDADGFRLHTASGDKTFLPGVNLGSTTPLHQPGEVGGIPPEQFASWLEQMGEKERATQVLQQALARAIGRRANLPKVKARRVQARAEGSMWRPEYERD